MEEKLNDDMRCLEVKNFFRSKQNPNVYTTERVYIQFQILHHRYTTNELLFKMKLKIFR